MDNIGEGYRKEGNLDKAEKIHEECFAKRRKTLGDDHAARLSSMDHLAQTY